MDRTTLPARPATPTRERDLLYAHQRLGTLSRLLRLHATTDLSDSVTRSHYHVLRARACLSEALEREGER